MKRGLNKSQCMDCSPKNCPLYSGGRCREGAVSRGSTVFLKNRGNKTLRNIVSPKS